MTSNKLLLLQTAEDLKRALDAVQREGNTEQLRGNVRAQLARVDLCIKERARSKDYVSAYNDLRTAVNSYLLLRTSTSRNQEERRTRFERVSELLTRIIFLNATAQPATEDEAPAETFDEDLRQGLRASSVAPPYNNVYVLGCFETKKTLLTQQTRAIALSVAILKYWNAPTRPKIGIVGGGIAGVTAMCTLLKGGADVTLFERAKELMPLQRGCTERFLHPHLYDWPAPGSDKSNTDLPFLNWEAGYANEVVNQLDPQIDQILAEHGARTPLTEYPVEHIEKHQGSTRFTIDSDSKNDLHLFDIVILAIGFGIERSAWPNIRVPGYWDNHPLHNTGMFDLRRPGQLLISGCGDGALVDVVRGAFNRFEHAEIVSLVPELEQSHIKEQLLEIEERAEGHLVMTDSDSFLLYSAYEELLDGISFPAEVAGKLASDYRVTFNSSRMGKFKLRTSILNRVLVHLLIANDHINFKSGKLMDLKQLAPSGTSSGKFEANIRNKTDLFDDVVVRYGVDPHSHFKGQFSDIYDAGVANFSTIAKLEMTSRLPANLNQVLSAFRARWV